MQKPSEIIRDDAVWRLWEAELRTLSLAASTIIEAAFDGHDDVSLNLPFPPEELFERLNFMADMLSALAENFRTVADMKRDYRSTVN